MTNRNAQLSRHAERYPTLAAGIGEFEDTSSSRTYFLIVI